VQTGVFNQRADADAQKATLAMQGIQTQLSESSVDGTTVWRVRIGPFTSIEDTASTRSKLTIIGIKPTVIRVNKS
jgi:cell division protein FtsN